MGKPTTGKYSHKDYKCNRCGAIESHGTNHWGKIYNIRCKSCSWKNPMEPFVTMDCQEPLPEGYAKLEEWKTMKLGDLIESKPKEKTMTDKEKEFNEKYGQSKNGNFYFFDIIMSPHPYMITHHHVVYAANHHGGTLGDYAIEDAEKNGIKCGMKGCNLSWKQHEKVLLIKCKIDIKDPNDPENKKAHPELHEWLMSVNEKVTEDGYAGYAFMKDE